MIGRRYANLLPAALLFFSVAAGELAAEDRDGLDEIVSAIEELEGQSDPKCHATASRLEDFMFGTPLTAEARARKVELQRGLVTSVWDRVSRSEEMRGSSAISAATLAQELDRVLPRYRTTNGDVVISGGERDPISVSAIDLRQYGSVAYALRTILAVQQDALLDPTARLLPLSADAIEELKDVLDVATLAALQHADSLARERGLPNVDEELIESGWERVFGSNQPALQTASDLEPAVSSGPVVLQRIIEQKLASYESYNEMQASLLISNIRSYYARHELPPPDEAVATTGAFSQAMMLIVGDFVRRSEQLAIDEGSGVVREPHVASVIRDVAPFQINEYEDITYFYNLPPAVQVTIEAYDADSFRDSGIHWLLIKRVLEDSSFEPRRDFDPFAAELLAETTAQVGVLLFRVAGRLAKVEKAPMLLPEHIYKSARMIRDLMRAHFDAETRTAAAAPVRSTGSTSRVEGAFFTEKTAESGIDFVHRSADWLKRFERTFLYPRRNADGELHSLDVPPVFGGSGVAADDVNGDGFDDILLLGGLGNRLYLGDGAGRFVDATADSGLDWIGPDGHPGEPRQPLIADLDNDGHQDVVITYAGAPHRLYRNRGGIDFEDVTEGSGLGGEGLVGSAATLLDYDRDGLLDIYVSYYGNYLAGDGPTIARVNENTTPNRLFRNLGGFVFEDVTDRAGVGNRGWSQAAVAVDFDRDGWQDLIVGNDFGVNSYYRNLGDGTFADVAQNLGSRVPSNSMNVGTSDLNRDGYPDIYISNIFFMVKDEKYVNPNEDARMKRDPAKLATMRIVDANHLFLSVAPEDSLERYQMSLAVDRGGVPTGWAWDADFFDVDNDGDDDLYCVNGLNEYNTYAPAILVDGSEAERTLRAGYAGVNVKEINAFFLNEDGRLANRSEGSGADVRVNSRGAAYLDYDSDGDLDVIINNYEGPATLLENTVGSGSGKWAKVRLVGDPRLGSNRDAIGSTLVFRTPTSGEIWRAVQGGTGYLSHHPKTVHVGLGEADSFDLEVTWPNGEVTRHEGLDAKALHVIRQSEASLR